MDIPDPRSLPVRRIDKRGANKKIKVVRRHDEDDLQANIFALFNSHKANDVICFSIPNGAFRDWNTAKLLKRTGVMPGITDLVFLNVFGIAFFMEVKAKKGSLRKEQRDFRDWCKANNIAWTLVRTLADAEAWMERHGLIKSRH